MSLAHNVPFRRVYVHHSSKSESQQSYSGFGNAKDDDANEDVLFAGDPIVYHGGWGSQVCYHHPVKKNSQLIQTKSPENRRLSMIRERVSTSGTVRPLEPECDLPALQIPPEHLGIVP